MKKDLGEDTVQFLAICSLICCRHLGQLKGKFLFLQALNQLQPASSVIRTHTSTPFSLCLFVGLQYLSNPYHKLLYNFQCVGTDVYLALETLLLSKMP